MHPVRYLFEDIYRNDWSIGLGASSSKRRGRSGLSIRDLRLLVTRERN
ncbi:hypothetical protein [Mesorhizobium loti]|nr:hypothetical protein [Mesorhizobium loti]